ncbi:DNA/RNA nuclease SfsA [Proteinivorax hydrogeniformans]|uniref:Sugar fermentation stimulation protein homolog n=1 Tax=Proteinivorax hydrogeniformans TaxID=1826727 RepID=A0AAU8HS91_9FIRM
MSYINIKGQLVKAAFVKRNNRFSCDVLYNGEVVSCHLPTSGRLAELLLPDATVYIRKAVGEVQKRKTKYDLLQVDTKKGVRVSLDSQLPNRFVEKLLIENNMPGFCDLKLIRREYTYGKSRMDFLVEDKKGVKTLIEVKSVTLVEDQIAKFPDAPTTRGTKHLNELTKSVKEGYKAKVLFMIQRNDAKSFSPNIKTDPQFSEALKEAHKSKVEINAFNCNIGKVIELGDEVEVEY